MGYVFTVGSTGDSPVPSGDPPDGTERGIERNNAVFSHSGYTTTPPGESPGGAGGSPAPPSANRYPSGERRIERNPLGSLFGDPDTVPPKVPSPYGTQDGCRYRFVRLSFASSNRKESRSSA